MKYCHECGSEIAQIDTFCPFCGIALIPADVSEDSPEVQEQDKTIAINQTDLQESMPQTSAAKSSDALDSDFSNETDKNQKIAPVESFLNEDSKMKDLESDSKSLSENGEIEEQNKHEENTENPSPIESPKMQEKSEPSDAFDATIMDVPTPQVLKENDVQAKESTNSDNEKNDRDLPQTNDKSDPEISRLDLQASFSNKDTDNPSDETEFTPTIPYVNLQNLDIQNAKISDSNQNASQNIDSENEKVIEKPEIPVEAVEAHDTTFDSVRIMESESEKSRSEFRKPIVENESKSETVGKPESASVEPKERTHTTPNIGIGDTDGRKSPKLKPLDEGTVLNGRYEIVRKIGGGGMGAVYLATDRNLGGILRAVKEMIQSYIEEEQQDKAISDFKRESMLLTSLDHTSIPTIYDYFYDDKEGRFYLVMKYISGGDLASRLRAAPEGRIDEETVVGWAIQIADVLDYLHNRQPPIVYRDLKPANIMVDGNTGRTMLIDFGIARWINKEEKGVTAVGTMGYAPPELFSGKVEPSSDIYSLGSTMFHLLTGADPQSNPLLIFDFQKHPRPRQINPQLSDQIEKILLKMVEYNADRRYKTAGEVRDELKKHLENLTAGKATFGISKTPSAVPFSEQTVFCGFCGQKIVATDMFCAFCGSKQPIAQQGVHSAEYHLPMSTARLFVIGTNDLEVPTFVIEKDDNLVGRRDPLSNIFPEVDLSKYDPQTKISRRHAHIWRNGNDFLLEDLGSSNGTLVLRVIGDAIKLSPHQPHTLVNGEKIKIGDTTLHFVIG